MLENLEGRTHFALTALPVATEHESFTVGRSVADPVRNVVYAVDATNHKVLAVDTDVGRKVSDVNLRGVAGSLAVSPDGKLLYVSEPGTFKIEAFALPDLTLARTLDVGQAVGNMVVGAGDKLYGSVSGSVWTAVSQIDAVTGKLGPQLVNNSYAPLLRTNAAGTHVYLRETGLSGGGGTIDEYDVSNTSAPVFLRGIPAPLSNSQDFTVDEAAHRIYTSDGGVYGLGVVNTDTGANAFWSIDPYGASAATREDSPYVFGMTYDAVEQFDKSTGIGLHYNEFSFLSASSESLKMTPNGRVSFTGESQFSLLGRSSLVIDNVPTARFTTAPGATPYDVKFDASASTPYLASQSLTQFTWTFGDGTTATGKTVTHHYASSSNGFPVKLTVASSTGLSDDFKATVPAGLITLPANVAGFTFDDTNRNGLYEIGEPKTSGKTVYLDANNNGKLDTGEASQVTGANGFWNFTKLTGGTYHIRRVFPGTYVQSNAPIDVTLTAGQSVVGLSIGSKSRSSVPPPPTGTASLSGTVFADNNANAKYDSGDGVGNAVTVFLDSDNDGVLDSGEKSVITDSGGKFAFTGLAAGGYHVRRVLPSGYTYSTAKIDLTLTNGQAKTGLLIGTKKA